MHESHRDTSSAKGDRKLPISQIVALAMEDHLSDECRYEGNSDEGFHTQLWSFTRAVRSCYAERADPHEVFFRDVDPEIRKRGGWSILGSDLNDEQAYLEFVSNWRDIRHRKGESPLSNAFEKAKNSPLGPMRCQDPAAEQRLRDTASSSASRGGCR